VRACTQASSALPSGKCVAERVIVERARDAGPGVLASLRSACLPGRIVISYAAWEKEAMTAAFDALLVQRRRRCRPARVLARHASGISGGSRRDRHLCSPRAVHLGFGAKSQAFARATSGASRSSAWPRSE
jgi:hypothetical protein